MRLVGGGGGGGKIGRARPVGRKAAAHLFMHSNEEKMCGRECADGCARHMAHHSQSCQYSASKGKAHRKTCRGKIYKTPAYCRFAMALEAVPGLATRLCE